MNRKPLNVRPGNALMVGGVLAMLTVSAPAAAGEDGVGTGICWDTRTQSHQPCDTSPSGSGYDSSDREYGPGSIPYELGRKINQGLRGAIALPGNIVNGLLGLPGAAVKVLTQQPPEPKMALGPREGTGGSFGIRSTPQNPQLDESEDQAEADNRTAFAQAHSAAMGAERAAAEWKLEKSRRPSGCMFDDRRGCDQVDAVMKEINGKRPGNLMSEMYMKLSVNHPREVEAVRQSGYRALAAEANYKDAKHRRDTTSDSFQRALVDMELKTANEERKAANEQLTETREVLQQIVIRETVYAGDVPTKTADDQLPLKVTPR
jgi:hypothetical protein